MGRAYGPQDEPEAYLSGIQYAESRGSKTPYKAVGDNGASLGAFQIKEIMFKDIQRLMPAKWGRMSYEQMLTRPELQRAAAHDGLTLLKYHYGLKGDRLMSAWNTGPTQARKGVFNAKYAATVHEGMKKAPYHGGLEDFE